MSDENTSDPTPVIDGQGNVLGTVGFTCDITERKQVEEALRIAAIAFETQDGLMVTDVNSVILRVNKAFTEISGYTAEEAIGKTPRLLKSGRHDATFYAALWESLNRTGVWNGEILNRRKNGEIYPEYHSITAVKGSNYEVTHYVGTMRDITDRIVAEKAIQKLNADLDATLCAIPDLLFELDQDGKYLNIWAHDPELLAAQKESLLGHSVSEMLPPEAAAIVMSALQEAAAQGYSHGQVIRLDLPQGEIWFELSTSLKALQGDFDKHFIMLSRDITVRKQAENALREKWLRLFGQNFLFHK